jgi:hypothetical protein
MLQTRPLLQELTKSKAGGQYVDRNNLSIIGCTPTAVKFGTSMTWKVDTMKGSMMPCCMLVLGLTGCSVAAAQP